MDIALIGNGAIASYVRQAATDRGHAVSAVIVRPERLIGTEGARGDGPAWVASVDDLSDGIDHVVDCAGHAGLAAHGPAVLRAGYDLTTLAIGALAEQDLADRLEEAARAGDARLSLASGAIGALDCLGAARIGRLDAVRYVGRKPPSGWLGSPAERVLDLHSMEGEARSHFRGTARDAAISYPKNANVAAAVALAGLGFDATEVELIADPSIERNVHEIHAEGDFGAFDFRIEGKSLPDNPRSSALAAMSAVCTFERTRDRVAF